LDNFLIKNKINNEELNRFKKLPKELKEVCLLSGKLENTNNSINSSSNNNLESYNLLKNKLSSLQENLSDKEDKIEFLEENLLNKENEIKSLQSYNLRSEKIIDQNNKDIKILQNQFDELTISQQKVNSSNQELQKQVLQLTKLQKKLEEEKEKLIDDNQELNYGLNNSKNQIKKLQSEI
jgi:chromosome segregation ATPase